MSDEICPRVPCQLCGHPTLMTATKMCHSCWELDHRITAQPFLAAKILERLKKHHKTDFLKKDEQYGHSL